MKISNLKQFEAFLKTRIPSREALFCGDIGLRRAKYFVRLLGNPQNKIKVIHVAGTSGKGSTCNILSHVLVGQGCKVGLSISPHVFDIRERMQINNQLPSEKLVLKYFNQILPVIQQMEKTKYGSPTFFEINVALAYYIFAHEKIDYAIMETGLGGTLDGTNTVTNKNKICLLTKLGIDHTEILGKTISKIAEQKAGIIQKQNTVISNQQSVTCNKIIQTKCETKKAQLYFVSKKNYKILSSSIKETVFDFNLDGFKLKNIKLGLIGIHQAQNCSLALSCLNIISERDKLILDEKKLRKSLEKIQIAGRFEIRKIKGKEIVIDGAHNPQKMQTFISNLAKIYPEQNFDFIITFKKGKDYQSMLKIILPFANKIYLASFSTNNQDNHLSSVDQNEIAEFLKSQNFSNFKIIEKHSDILQNVRMSKKRVVFTGSLYFIAKIFK